MANQIDINDIKLHEIIQYGNFGEVFKAEWRGQTIVAKPFQVPLLNLGTGSMLDIRHKSIIQIYGTADKYYLIEYVDCGSLHDFLHGEEQREYTIMDGINWMYQTALGLDYLRSLRFYANVAYRSLRSSGLMLSDKFRSVKISGFPHTITFPMTPNEYLAPEAIKGETDFTGKCDVYSLGIIFWELLTRKKPFYHSGFTNKTLGGAVLRGERPQLSDIKFLDNDPIKKLIQNCWQSDPADRNAAETVAYILLNCLSDYKDSTFTHVFGADIGAIVDSEDIRICEKIGEGSFGVTYKALWLYKDTNVKKIKQTNEENTLNQQLKKQVRKLLIRESLEFYDHIVHIYGIYIHEKSTYLMSEYSECGSLSNYLHGVDQKDYSVGAVIDWMYQAARGITYIAHLKTLCPIINYNIKPQNMLFFENFTRLKISDYCSPIDDCDWVKHNKDIVYIAPEVFRELKFTKESAVYSLGIIFWETMSRRKPFYHFGNMPQHMAITQICRGERPALSDMRKSCYNFIEQLITSCWDQNKAKRPSIDELCSLLLDFESTISEPYKTPTVVLKDIKLSRVVGRGSYGIVYKASWGGKDIALKKCIGISFLTEDTAMKNFEKEVKQLARVDHENIVKLYGITFDKESAYILMEYADCGSLSKLLHGEEQGSYTMADAIYWMIQCVKGIHHLHTMEPKPLLHRDLKPDNLLLTDNFRTLKIGDFGTVTESATLMTKECGTPAYMAPEVVKGKKYTEKCDIYSFGIILWEILSRKKPYGHLENPNGEAIKYNAVNGNRPQLRNITLPNCLKVKELIKTCWDQNPDKRPTVQTIRLCDIPCTHTPIRPSVGFMVIFE